MPPAPARARRDESADPLRLRTRGVQQDQRAGAAYQPVVILRSVRLLTRAVQCWPRVALNRDRQGPDAATSATSCYLKCSADFSFSAQ